MTQTESETGIRYEKADVQEGAIARAGIILAVVALVSGLVVLGLFHFLLGRELRAEPPPPPLARAAGRQPPEPRLQERPTADVSALRAEEHEILTSHGWVDERRGVVRIPIEDAMRILAQRGLPLTAARSAASAAGGTARPEAGRPDAGPEVKK
jgi:hypothetical protein